MISLSVLKEKELQSNISELAKLRLTIFREYPYLYGGDLQSEKDYLSLFESSSDALLIIAKFENQMVGALSGLPLNMAQQEIKDAFKKSSIDIEDYYALCDILVLKEYRNRKMGSLLYQEFENQLQNMQQYKNFTLWQIVKEPDDPKRPRDYFSPNSFWLKRGFVKDSKLECFLYWQEISERKKSAHHMEFWLRKKLDCGHRMS